MTTVTLPAPLERPRGGRPHWAFFDAVTVTWRNLIAYTRIPDAIFFSSVQPIMFVLLFRFVFGGAIHVQGVSYTDYLMAGIFVQTVLFGSVSTAVGLSEDLHKGLIERFRALPMARSAVLAGRTTADLVRNVGVVILISAVGFAVGFRILTSVGLFLAAMLLILFFAYAVSWGFAYIGLSASNSETAQLMAFPILFPFIFASSAFVPVTTMPGWLQAFAKNQPVSQVIDASRQLMLGGHSELWSTRNIWLALAWTVGLLAVLVPLAVRKYRRAT
jgi:ABC-2 type transport system permease protein